MAPDALTLVEKLRQHSRWLKASPTYDADRDERKTATLIDLAADALAARETLTREEVQHLRRYVEEMGSPHHDDGCPEDDTCDCSWKPTLDVVNALCNRKSEPALTREEAERRLRDKGWKDWVIAALLADLFPDDGSR